MSLEILVSLVFFCLTASLSFADVPAQPQAPCQVKDIQIEGLHTLRPEVLLYLLNLKSGTPLDAMVVRRGIRRAFLKGIFDDLIVETPDRESCRLKIVVKEKKVIDSIRVVGNEHFSGRFIKNQLTTQTGERLNMLKLKESLAKLKGRLAEKGFREAEIDYETIPLPDNRVQITITVKEGAPVIIRTIDIREQGDDLRDSLKLKEGDIFDQSVLDKFIEKVKTKSKKQGYVKTSVQYTFKDGSLTLTFDKGRRLNLAFTGNSALSARTLKREVTFYEINDFSDDLVDETIGRMVTLYHQKGYANARIAPVVTESDDVISLEFFIFEGDRLRVNSVTFQGASLSPDRLRDSLSLKVGGDYDPDSLESDREALVDFYQALGYLSVAVKEPVVTVEDRKVSLDYTIIEGSAVKLDRIILKGNRMVSEEALLSSVGVKKGDPYNEINILEGKKKILDLYRKQGFLEARVTVSRDIGEELASVTFTVNEGEKTLFGKSIIAGNRVTKRQVIVREFRHKEGDPFDYGILFDERSKLLRTGLFSDIELVPWEKTGAERDIVYRFDEADAGSVEFGIGYGEFDKFRGFFDIGYRNLWGMNKQASFRAELSTLDQRAILSYSEPRFLGRELPLKAFVLGEHKKELNFDTRETLYKLTRYAATLGTDKNLSKEVKAELYYEFSVVNTYDIQPDVVLSKEDTGTLIISGVRMGLIYDSRDNPFTPRSGILAGLSFKVTSPILFSETDFVKLTLSVNKYQGLNKWLVLALSLRGGVAKGYGDTTELPIVERFFLGGRTTVRGYKQDTLGPKGSDGNPTGGDAFLMGNVELRSDVGKGFGLVTFLDWGNVWTKVSDVDIGSLKYTTGVGLRYNTPVGPLSADYGIKLNRGPGESRGEFHFSIGHAF